MAWIIQGRKSLIEKIREIKNTVINIRFIYMKIITDITAVGQVEPNSIIQGDCLEAMKFIADKSVDMILCDLPYG